jgi:integrase
MGRKRTAANRAFPPNLYQNPNGYFYYRNPRSGLRRGIGKDKASAFIEARAANAALAGMSKSSLASWVSGKSEYTLEKWVPIYKEMWLEKSKPAVSTLKNATGYLNRIATCEFAWMELKDIGTSHAAKFLSTVESVSGAGAAINMRSRLHDVFRMAETQGIIEVGKNPVSATYTPDSTVKRERLSLEQFYAIQEVAPIWLQRAMMLALLTAQRRDDITKLKFSDYKDGFLHIVQKKSQGQIRLRQDGKIRLEKVGMSIDDSIQNCRDLLASNLLIHHVARNGTAEPGDQVSSDGLSSAFQAARNAAGISAGSGRTPPSFHEIRSLSERLYREQYGAAFAQAMLGHKSAKMTARYNDMRGQGWHVITV